MKIEKLPKKIAIFPLSNAVFFPKTILPLNIFEQRYIELVDDCMKDQKFLKDGGKLIFPLPDIEII